MKMKTKKMLIASSIILCFAAPSAFAANDSFLKGKPFEYLKAKSDANANAITDLTQVTADLAAEITQINLDITELEGRVDVNETSIANINTAIDSLEVAIDANSADISMLRSNIDTLRSNHATDINALLLMIDGLRASIANLRTATDGALADLGTRIDILQVEVDANTGNVTGLLADTIQALADIVAMQAVLDDHESRLVDAESHLTSVDIQIAAINDRLNAIDIRLAGHDTAIDDLQALHTAHFSGVQNDIPVADLNGWTQCFSRTYADRDAFASTMRAQCTKANLIVACRLPGDSVLRVMAEAPRVDVFHEDGNGATTSRLVNGAQWYYSDNYSMGFAPAGEAVRRNSADVLNRSSNNRLSWHTHHTFTGGYRCGNLISNAGVWEKMIFESDN